MNTFISKEHANIFSWKAEEMWFVGASQWKNTSDSIPAALGEMHAWVTYKEQFSRKAISLPPRCALLLSFIHAALTPPEKHQFICKGLSNATKPLLQIQNWSWSDPCFYTEGQTKEPVLTGLFPSRKLAEASDLSARLSLCIPSMDDFAVSILQFVYFSYIPFFILEACISGHWEPLLSWLAQKNNLGKI